MPVTTTRLGVVVVPLPHDADTMGPVRSSFSPLIWVIASGIFYVHTRNIDRGKSMVQPEYRISKDIMKAVKERGGFCFKVHGSEHMVAGLPDIICCYRGMFVGFEVKTPTGTVSERQRYIMRRIMDAEGVVTVPRSVADALDVLDRIDEWLDAPEARTGTLRDVFFNPRWRT